LPLFLKKLATVVEKIPPLAWAPLGDLKGVSSEYVTQLLLAAREQTERSESAVRAVALMHIVRVLARSDQIAAEELLERAISLAKELDTYGASLLLCNAVYLAAAVYQDAVVSRPRVGGLHYRYDRAA
jgi:hypothetical protein